jgi:hypothetical protein
MWYISPCSRSATERRRREEAEVRTRGLLLAIVCLLGTYVVASGQPPGPPDPNETSPNWAIGDDTWTQWMVGGIGDNDVWGGWREAHASAWAWSAGADVVSTAWLTMCGGVPVIEMREGPDLGVLSDAQGQFEWMLSAGVYGNGGEARARCDCTSTLEAPGTQGYRHQPDAAPDVNQLVPGRHEEHGTQPWGLWAVSTFTTTGSVHLHLYVCAYAEADAAIPGTDTAEGVAGVDEWCPISSIASRYVVAKED